MNRSVSITCKIYIVLLLTLLLPLNQVAAESKDEQQPQQEVLDPSVKQEPSAEQEPSAKQKPKADPTAGTFVPSEKISEDLSVSFPVDI